MAGKLNVYALGQRGVQIVKNPIQTEDGELESAQNALEVALDGELALQKRGGLSKINSVAASGTIYAIFNCGVGS